LNESKHTGKRRLPNPPSKPSSLVVWTLVLVASLSVSAAAASTESGVELNKSFEAVQFDEGDLAHLADIISELPKRSGGNIQIRITSGDGQETLKTSDPGAFLSSDIPRQVRSVEIAYQKVDAPVSVDLAVGSPYSWGLNGTRLRVTGSDTDLATAIFGKLDRIIQQNRPSSAWLTVEPDNHASLGGLVLFLLGLLILGLSVYVEFWTLFSIFVRNPNPAVLEAARGILAVLSAVIGLLLFMFIQKCFPPVRFTGRLSDVSTYPRSILLWVVAVVLVPTAIGQLSLWLSALRKSAQISHDAAGPES
jgi:hypothetical protein